MNFWKMDEIVKNIRWRNEKFHFKSFQMKKIYCWKRSKARSSDDFSVSLNAESEMTKFPFSFATKNVESNLRKFLDKIFLNFVLLRKKKKLFGDFHFQFERVSMVNASLMIKKISSTWKFVRLFFVEMIEEEEDVHMDEDEHDEFLFFVGEFIQWK